MIADKVGSTVVVTGDSSRDVVDRLSRERGVWKCDDLSQLLREDVLSNLAVLVVVAGPFLCGVSLAVLGWINLEYPRIQKVAVVEGPLSLPVVRFLTSCGVELIWAKPNGGVEHIVSVVDRMKGRSGWIAPWIAPAAPPSLCISTTSGTVPQMFVLPPADHSSAHSPMALEGVIG